MNEDAVRRAFAWQEDWAGKLGAPFTARLCAALAHVIDRSTATGRRVLDWPGDPIADVLVLRLTGGLNALVRAGHLPRLAARYPPHETNDDMLAAALAEALRADRLLPWLDSAPQTNEVGRSAVLMAGLLEVGAATRLPLALFELGASAGLNLRCDRYRYTLGGRSFGPADAPLHLAPEWEGPAPAHARVEVVGRRGVDLAPIDVRDAAARERLLAYVWPEQAKRIARLEAALASAATDPPIIDAGDAAAWVEAQVAPVEGRATVVLHSIAFQYFPPATQERIGAHLAAMGARATATAPLAWLRYEFDMFEGGASPTLRLRMWPSEADRLLAHAHPHGASVQWLG